MRGALDAEGHTMYSSLYVSQQIVPLGGTKLPHLVAPYAAPPITPPSLQSIEWDMLLLPPRPPPHPPPCRA